MLSTQRSGDASQQPFAQVRPVFGGFEDPYSAWRFQRPAALPWGEPASLFLSRASAEASWTSGLAAPSSAELRVEGAFEESRRLAEERLRQSAGSARPAPYLETKDSGNAAGEAASAVSGCSKVRRASDERLWAGW